MAHTKPSSICVMLTLTDRTVAQGITDLAAFARAVCQPPDVSRSSRVSRSPDRPRFKKKKPNTHT